MKLRASWRYTGSLCKSYAEKSRVSSSVLLCPILSPKDAKCNQRPMYYFDHLLLAQMEDLKLYPWHSAAGLQRMQAG